MPVIDTPCEVVKSIALWSVVYVWLPEKYASSDVAMLRRSDFSEARYAFSLVLANFGIAIAARMPMITTTMSSSIKVKPLRTVRRMIELLVWRELDAPPGRDRACLLSVVDRKTQHIQRNHNCISLRANLLYRN